MDRSMAAKWSAGELATSIGDHLVYVHVELGAAAGHPDMQGKHVAMLPGQNLVAGLNDQLVTLIIEPFAIVVRDGGGLLQGGIGRDHLARDQVSPDAEMLERTLSLRTPQLVVGDFNDTEAVSLFSHLGHGFSPLLFEWMTLPSEIDRACSDGSCAPLTSAGTQCKCNLV